LLGFRVATYACKREGASDKGCQGWVEHRRVPKVSWAGIWRGLTLRIVAGSGMSSFLSNLTSTSVGWFRWKNTWEEVWNPVAWSWRKTWRSCVQDCSHTRLTTRSIRNTERDVRFNTPRQPMIHRWKFQLSPLERAETPFNDAQAFHRHRRHLRRSACHHWSQSPTCRRSERLAQSRVCQCESPHCRWRSDTAWCGGKRVSQLPTERFMALVSSEFSLKLCHNLMTTVLMSLGFLGIVTDQITTTSDAVWTDDTNSLHIGSI